MPILRLERLVESARLGWWCWDFRTQQFEWSQMSLELFGVDRATRATYDLWLERVHPDDRDRVHREARHSIKHRDQFNVDYRVVWPDASVHWLTSFAQPTFSGSGNALTLEGFIREITPRKQAEALAQQQLREIDELHEQLRRRAIEAEAAVHTKNAFLRNISHELRTPLNHVVGGIDLLRLQPHVAEQDRWLHIVHQSSHRLLLMIEQLLQTTEAEAENATVQRRPFSPRAMLSEIVTATAPRVRDAKVTVEAQLDSRLPDEVVGDPTLIAQALFNYLDNAVKFAPPESAVQVAARVAAEDRGRLVVRFEVRDQGPGVPDELRPSLFKVFTLEDSAIHRLHGGLGLGLARTRRLASALDGQVGFTSEPGKETCFWLTVPLERAN